jgi:hypothetical protein
VIYFAQLGTGAIKIGCTEDLGQRLQTLERQYGPRIKADEGKGS